VIAAIFYFANVPDVKSADDYHLDEKDDRKKAVEVDQRELSRPMIYVMLLLNAEVLILATGMILWVILSTLNVSDSTMSSVLWTGGVVATVAAVVMLLPVARKISHHSVWSHPHFSSAILAQFFYVAAQAGIFSFFINYMTSEVPAIPASWASGFMSGWFELGKNGLMHISDKGAANLASVGSFCFLAGRFSGAGLLRKFSAHRVLGLYGVMNVFVCLIIFLKLGWLSVACVFLSYFFMSIMFPTIFALGIFGLGARAKKASAFIVMAIMGGAILPKLMGHVADKYDMSTGFIVPALCFGVVAFYGLAWSKLSKAESLGGIGVASGH
jgi:FHS family L-fucose permease-like MFS transporter